ncbi:DUF4142 domain-containing protein [Phenylobacterium soli]|uniref:DUF4142 domain-containing protein n=1 Tax=Phenylobacterium soli TaxID=2170551 RepID=A0A328ALM9_9CAUL|nr:DUF4142 domain-containing protein [Phenylobacterium soli]RAK55853.1 hypothetical protein DJ017_15715 [Phenylobacterium soli]
MFYRLLGGAAAVLVLTGAAQAQPRAHQSSEDRHFLTEAIRGDNSEMMLGQMATERAVSPRVRDFGRTLHDDHAHARDAAMRIAARFGVPDTQAITPEARAEAAKLRRLRGRAFDREFVRYMQHDHRKDIAEFRHEARMGGPVGQLAGQTLPDLQKHLRMAQDLDRG